MTQEERDRRIEMCEVMVQHCIQCGNAQGVAVWRAAIDTLADFTEDVLDLHLLAKLASGEGGRRTGALKRAGYLEWTVTDAGLAALSKLK